MPSRSRAEAPKGHPHSLHLEFQSGVCQRCALQRICCGAVILAQSHADFPTRSMQPHPRVVGQGQFRSGGGCQSPGPGIERALDGIGFPWPLEVFDEEFDFRCQPGAVASRVDPSRLVEKIFRPLRPGQGGIYPKEVIFRPGRIEAEQAPACRPHERAAAIVKSQGRRRLACSLQCSAKFLHHNPGT